MGDKLPRLDKKSFSVGNLHDNNELVYWRSKTPLERLEAIEINRRMVYGHDKATSRLQRFLEITQLPQS